MSRRAPERKVDAALLPSQAEFSPYQGLTLNGWPMTTLLRGRVAFTREPDGELSFPAGPCGRLLLPRKDGTK